MSNLRAQKRLFVYRCWSIITPLLLQHVGQSYLILGYRKVQELERRENTSPEKLRQWLSDLGLYSSEY